LLFHPSHSAVLQASIAYTLFASPVAMSLNIFWFYLLCRAALGLDKDDGKAHTS